ncbi:MAG: hypothetical protein ACREA1_00395 [Nitrosotalea sp.]
MKILHVVILAGLGIVLTSIVPIVFVSNVTPNGKVNALSETQCGTFHNISENKSYLNTVPVLLMNSDSTACAKLTFTIVSNYKNCNGPECQRVFDLGSIVRMSNMHYENNGGSFSITLGKDYTNSFNIVAIPGVVDLANYPMGANFTVTYVIKSLLNATGFYDKSIPRLVCGYYPMAVGYTANNVNSSDFTPINPLGSTCPVGQYVLAKVEISGMNYTSVTLKLATLGR